MYSRLGGIDVPEIDALTACENYPHEFTREPWTRPDGRPYVDVPRDWQELGVLARADLARQTFPDLGRGSGIDFETQSDQLISEYIAGSTHPTAGKAGAL